MKKLLYPIMLVLVLVLSAKAQTQLKKWYINSHEFNMTTSPPTSIALTNGQSGLGNGIYDLNGEIQFYINGSGIYDRFKVLQTATFGSFNIQEVSIVPFFNNDPCHNKYYVFYEYLYPQNYGKLNYFIIDVDRSTWGLNISTPITILNNVTATGGAIAVGNVVNGTERYLYYVYGTNYFTNIIKYTIKVPSSINPNGIVIPGNTLLAFNTNSYKTPNFELDISSDGTKLAWGGNNGVFYVFGLDANGNNPNLQTTFSLPTTSLIDQRGVEFNSNGSKLYVGTGGTTGLLDGVYVKDLSNTNPPTLIGGTQNYGMGQIERAYNDLIYLTSGSDMIGIDQVADLLVPNSQVALPGSNNYYLPDQLDGTNYDDLLNNEITYNVNSYIVQSGTQIWEPLNNPFGNTINPVKIKDLLQIESNMPGIFAQVTIKNMVFEFGENAEMIIGNNANVILENTTLKSVNCASMWKGVTLNNNANFIATNNLTGQNSIIQDAITGITGVGLNFHLTLHGNTLLQANQNDIDLSGFEGGNIDIHNCDFLGNVVLKSQFYGNNTGWDDKLFRTNMQLKLLDGANNTIIGNNCNFSFSQIGVKVEKSNAVIKNCNFLRQNVFGISGDAKRVTKKRIDIKENLFTEVQQPIRLENWINSDIQKNTILTSYEYGIHYLYNEGCEVLIGDEFDPTKGNILDFCNWVGIDLSSNADPKTKITIANNFISNHKYATGICVSEFGQPSNGGSYDKLAISKNTMNHIGNGIKINNVAGWNDGYGGDGPTPHNGFFDSRAVIQNNEINYVTYWNPNYKGIQTTRSNSLNILYNKVTSDAPYDWRNCAILVDEAFQTSIYDNKCVGGLGIWMGGNMFTSNAYCNEVENSSIGFFLNYEYLRSIGSFHGIPTLQARENSFNSLSGIDIKLYQTNTDLNQWIFSSGPPFVDYSEAVGTIPLNINGGQGSDMCNPQIEGEKSIGESTAKSFNNNTNILQGSKNKTPVISSKLNNVELFKSELRNAKDSLIFKSGKFDFPSEIAIVEDLFIRKQFDSASKLMTSSKPINPIEKEVLLVYKIISNKMRNKDRKLSVGEIDTLLNIARKNQFTVSAASPVARIFLKEELHIDIYDSLEYFPVIRGKVGQNCNSGLLGNLVVKLITNSGIETGYSTITDSIGNFSFSMRNLQYLDANSRYRFKCVLLDSTFASCNSNMLGEFANLKDLTLSCNLILAKKANSNNQDKIIKLVDTKIYPNPNSGIFYIDCEDNSEITIFNLLGKIVYSNYHSSKSEINLSELPKGVYIVSSRSSILRTFKLLIE